MRASLHQKSGVVDPVEPPSPAKVAPYQPPPPGGPTILKAGIIVPLGARPR
jgi:hypothetical protein